MKDWRNLHGVPAWFLLFFWGGGGAVGVVDDDEFCWFISFWSSSVLVKKDAAENDAAISEWKASRNLKGKEKSLIWFFSLKFAYYKWENFWGRLIMNLFIDLVSSIYSNTYHTCTISLVVIWLFSGFFFSLLKLFSRFWWMLLWEMNLIILMRIDREGMAYGFVDPNSLSCNDI